MRPDTSPAVRAIGAVGRPYRARDGMRKTFLFYIAVVVLLASCAHGSPAEKRGARSMFYAHPLKEVVAAAKTVLLEQDYEITEINMTENFIRAIKGAKIPGKPITVVLVFRPEGESTWVDIHKDVPPQFIPGSTAGYRMDVDELFRYIELELDRNY